MEGVNRLSLICGHVLGNLSFSPDNSLDLYRQRGSKFNVQSLHEYYYKVFNPYYDEFVNIIKKLPSYSHKNSYNLSIEEKRAKA